MIEVNQERGGWWAVTFVSELRQARKAHCAISLRVALRVIRDLLELDMMEVEGVRETPLIGDGEAAAYSLAVLEEMSEAVDILDLGLDEEIRQRRAAQYVYSVPRKQSWVIQP